jgi:hypothetical protein
MKASDERLCARHLTPQLHFQLHFHTAPRYCFLQEITKKRLHQFVDLLYYNKPSLLHVSATYFGHNRWPKHVAVYDDYNIMNLHICTCTCLLLLIRNRHWMFMNQLKVKFHSCTVHFDLPTLLLLQPMHNKFALKH